MLWGSSVLSEFHTSLSKVLTLWHCVKVKQRYHSTHFVISYIQSHFCIFGIEEVCNPDIFANRQYPDCYFPFESVVCIDEK